MIDAEIQDPYIEELSYGVRTLADAVLGEAKAQEVLEIALGIRGKESRLEFLRSVGEHLAEMVEGGTSRKILTEANFRFRPVDIETFLLDSYYLGLKGQVYPEVLKEMKELNSGKYVEAVLTGGIGSAKTTMALWTTAYQVYLLSALVDPHWVFSLAQTDEIIMILQSITGKKSKELDYERLKTLVHRSPYFNDEFPYDKNIDSQLLFPNRITVKPLSGNPSAAIGENVIGGIIDEINFMARVENSKSSSNGTTFDQAMEMYHAIIRRRESRFMVGGRLYGMLCLVSSKNYPGQFTDMKEEDAQRQIRKTGETNIFVYDKRIWEIKPEGSFGKETFDLFCGDAMHKPRILEPGDTPPKGFDHLVMKVPATYKDSFERDMIGSLRDIAGVSTLASAPFIYDVDSITRAMILKNILKNDCFDFEEIKAQIRTGDIRDKAEPRAIHLDLSVTGDATGFAMGYLKGFTKVMRGDEPETLPQVVVEATAQIKPPKNGEILFFRIRKLIYKLSELGYNIRWITTDSYQSTDSRQILSSKGYTVGVVSMDTTNLPYEMLRDGLYDNRVVLPVHEHLRNELGRLEKDTKKNKIDHPPDFSKDVADAVAGVNYVLSTRRELYVRHNVPLQSIAESVKRAMDRDKMKKSEEDLTKEQI